MRRGIKAGLARMSYPRAAMTRCPTCWGTHGCDLPEGHDGDHACINGDHTPYIGPVNWDTACMIWSQDDPDSFPCP